MVAESEGFEPPIPLRVLLISNQVPSAAPPALHLSGGPAPPAPRTPAVRRRGPTRPVVGPLRLLAASQPDPRDPSSDRFVSSRPRSRTHETRRRTASSPLGLAAGPTRPVVGPLRLLSA